MTYSKDLSGQFSLVFALGSVVIIGAVGVAIDINNSTSFKGDLQDILDSAVLAGKVEDTANAHVELNVARSFFDDQYADVAD